MFLNRLNGKSSSFSLVMTLVVGMLFSFIGVIGFIEGEAVFISKSFDNSFTTHTGLVSIFINLGSLFAGISYVLDVIYSFKRRAELKKYAKKEYGKMNTFTKFFRWVGFFLVVIGLCLSCS